MKKKIGRGVPLGVLVLILAIVFFAGQAQAAPMDRPDWWDTADAQLILDSMPAPARLFSGIADGPAGFAYDYKVFSMVFPGAREDYLLVDLANLEDPGKWKLFWIAAHVNTQEPIDTISEDEIQQFFVITGYSSQDVPKGLDGFDYGWNAEGWVWMEAWMFPQPDRETFLVNILSEDGGFEVDYLELGTKCVVPVPSTLLLLGSGLFGLVAWRRKRS